MPGIEKKIQIDFSDSEDNINENENENIQTEVDDVEKNIEATPETPVDDIKIDKTEPDNIEIQSPGEYDVNEIFRFLSENGVVDVGDTPPELNSIDDVAKYVYNNNQKLITEQVEKELNTYPQSYQDLFKYVKNGGNVQDFTNSYKDSYSTLDQSMLKGNTELQRKVMKDYYKTTTQWSDDMINTQLSKFNDDEISKLSKTTLSELKTIEQNKQLELKNQQDKQIAKQQEDINLLMEVYHKSIDELKSIGNIPLTINDKKVIEDNLFNNKTYNKLTSDFEKYRMNLSILDSYGLLDDINKITDLLNSKTNSKKYNFKKSMKKTTDDDFNINIRKPTDTQKDKVAFIF